MQPQSFLSIYILYEYQVYSVVFYLFAGACTVVSNLYSGTSTGNLTYDHKGRQSRRIEGGGRSEAPPNVWVPLPSKLKNLALYFQNNVSEPFFKKKHARFAHII